ncbi:MAG: hypothetical protein HYR85_16525, partial [Planctomycetes bacterium]|nr:hypothetical protein [Planctomycetota bacterium]
MNVFRCSWIPRVLLALVFAALVAEGAAAQCFPDNLTGPCCQRTDVRLPDFPAIQQEIRFICFDNCQPRIDVRVCVDIAAPQPVTDAAGNRVCGIYLIRYTIRTCGAAAQVLWSDTMRAHYSRTWLEIAPGSTFPNSQVHRFLLNGDLVPSTFLIQHAGANTCVLPPCAARFGNRVHFWGYIDYSHLCQSPAPQFAAAWGLNHDCDIFEHGPVSARPVGAAPAHPDQSYVFVGPGAGFVIDSSALPPSIGGGSQEAVRHNRWANLPAICEFEEPVTQAAIDVVRQFCPCSTNTAAPPQYLESVLSVSSACGSAYRTSLPSPFPSVQKRIGLWTDPTVFPGRESLLFDQFFLDTIDGCAA